jgi:RNA polymerase sigma-70 factor (ECF subfamily)
MPSPRASTVSAAAARPEAQPHDDAALAAALLARDGGAATRAWSRFSPMVLGVLRRFFGPGTDRQDLCQEVFLRFFARIHELREPSALRGFLVGISLGVARNELRRLRVRRWIGLTARGDLPDVPVAACDLEAREAARRFYALLESVSVEDRSLFVARYVEKMEIVDVAAAHALPLSTAKRHLTRATRRISAKMSRDPALAQYVDTLRSGSAVKS